MRLVIIGAGFAGMYAHKSSRCGRWRETAGNGGRVLSIAAWVATDSWPPIDPPPQCNQGFS
jgi:hypothetical protein